VLFEEREAGIIKAGLTPDPDDGHYWDDGLFGFVPAITVDAFAAGTLTYDVQNETGTNPVWMSIEIDTGVVGDRTDNTKYQCVPTAYGAGWNTVDAAAGQWQKWNDNEGNTTGNPLISLSDVAAAHTGCTVIRTYLRLGMGDSYNVSPGVGTVAWVDKATVGGVTYDFVVPEYWHVAKTGLDTNEGTLASPFLTIQKAIDSASADDTIHVAAGTYLESNILVSKSLTIQGIGATQDDVVVAPAAEDGNADSAFSTSAQNGFVIKAHDVTIENLTINGRGNPALTAGKSNFRAGIVTLDASQSGGGAWNNLLVDDVVVQYTYRRGISVFPRSVYGTIIQNSTVEYVAYNHGMYLGGQSQALNNTVKHCFQGIVQDPDATTTNTDLVKANGNTLTEIGNFPGCWGYPNGQPRAIQCNPTGPARAFEVKDNTISDNGLEAGAGTVGVYTRLWTSDSVLSGNDITLTSGVSWAGTGSQAVGMLLGWNYDEGFTVADNHVHSGKYGIGMMVFGSGSAAKPMTLTGNTITSTASAALDTGDGSGVYVANQYLFAGDKSPSYLVVGDGNTISGFVRGINAELIPTSTQALTVIAHKTSIAGNTTGIDASTMTTPVDATANWWGAASGPGTVGPGSGDKVTTNVTYDPWYLDAGMTTLSDGVKVITAFSLNELSPAVIGTVTEGTHSVALTVPFGTNVTALVPTITHTGASISPDSGVAHDFTTPQEYIVTAVDASTQAYTVTVTVAPDPAKAITAFAVPGQVGATTISEADHTIAVTMPYGTVVTALVPTITITGASVNPASGVPCDFTTPQTYTVTAADSSTQDYTVTVTFAAAMLTDDVESGVNGWTAAGGTTTVAWHQTTRKANSPTHSWWFGNEATGYYASGSSRVQGTLTSPDIAAVAGSKVDLSFMQWRQVERYTSSGRDITQVLVKWGAGAFAAVWTQDSRTASVAAWQEVTIPNQSVPDGVTTMQVRFLFDSVSGTSNTYAGWFIDDIKVSPSPLEYVVDQEPLKVAEGASAQLGIRLSGQPTDPVGVAVTKLLGGDPDLTLTGTTDLTFTQANWMTYQVVTVAAAQDADALNGSATLRISLTSGVAVPDRDVVVQETDDEGWTDDVESGLNGWTAAGGTTTVTWHQTERKANSPAHSWWFGNEAAGTYASGYARVQGTLTSPEITVEAGSLVDVSWMQWRQVERYTSSGRDVTQVLVKWGAGPFTPVWTQDSRTTSVAAWQEVALPKQSVPNGATTMQVRFLFDSVSGTNNTYAGWFIDDVRVLPSPLEFVVDEEPVRVDEGSTADLWIRLSGKPMDPVEVAVTKVDGDADLTLTGTTTLTFTQANWMTYQLVTVAAAQDADALNGSATLRIRQTSGDPVPDRDVVAQENDDDGWTDDVESGVNGWTAAGGTTTVTWHQTTRKANSPTHSWWFGNEATGTYASGSSRVQGTLTSPEITVLAESLVDVSFMQWRQVERYTSSGRDITQVLVKWGAGAFAAVWTLDSRTASVAAWQEVTIPKQSVPAGVTTMQVQFRFDSVNSSYNSYAGWFVDDIKVLPSPLEFVVDQEPLKVGEGETAQLGIRLSGRPMDPVGVAVAKVDGDADLTLTGTTTLTFTPANWTTYQVVTVAAAEDADALNGSATLRISQTSGDPVPDRDVVAQETDDEGWTDDVESGVNGWTTAGGTTTVTWHQTTRKANSPTHSWWFGDEARADYRSGYSRVQGTLTSPDITVVAGSLVDLSWMQWRQVERYTLSGRDITQVLVKWGDGAFAAVWTLDSRTASLAAWQQITLSELLVPAGVTTMHVQFRFDSVNGTSNINAGWFIDDIRVLPSADIGPAAFEPDVVPSHEIRPLAFPNPADTEARFTITGIIPQALRVNVYDLAGAWIWAGEAEGDELRWDLNSADGDRVANGVYLYKLEYQMDGDTWRLCRVEKLFVLRR
jgi:hypothetical protein